jgi:hypothetical protein
VIEDAVVGEVVWVVPASVKDGYRDAVLVELLRALRIDPDALCTASLGPRRVVDAEPPKASGSEA